MGKLENYGVLELYNSEIQNIEGGGFLKDYLLGKAVDLIIDLIVSDNASYGEWLLKTEGSRGAW